MFRRKYACCNLYNTDTCSNWLTFENFLQYVARVLHWWKVKVKLQNCVTNKRSCVGIAGRRAGHCCWVRTSIAGSDRWRHSRPAPTPARPPDTSALKEKSRKTSSWRYNEWLREFAMNNHVWSGAVVSAVFVLCDSDWKSAPCKDAAQLLLSRLLSSYCFLVRFSDNLPAHPQSWMSLWYFIWIISFEVSNI